MTKITRTNLQTSILLLVCLFSINSFSQIFDWETATDNGDFATQTVGGVTATVTTNIITTITDNISVLDINGLSGTSGFSVFNGLGNNSDSFTVSFSAPIDIASFFAWDADRIVGNTWTFTPAGGNNSPVVQAIQNDIGSTITVNWTDITSFTITSAQVNDTFGIDNIVFATTLGTENFTIENNVNVYPNPTSDYIHVSGLKNATNFQIFNVLGKQVLKGSVSDVTNINVQNLTNGLYFIKLENNDTLKFIKK